MTRTRSQMAAANVAALEPEKPKPVNHKIHKTLRATPDVTKKAKGKNSKAKVADKPKEITYSEELVNLPSFIKKFDIDAVMDQTGNCIGDSHLPRATLNQIIKEALPSDVRAQRETMDLICFISNAFVDLLSDTSNNVCTSQNKKNIIPEHAIRALQQLHLDEYLPFLLTDNQNLTLPEIVSDEKTFVQPANDDQRESLVNTMLKRLSESQISGGRGRNKKKKLMASGQTNQEIEENQHNDGDEDSDAEYFRQNNPDQSGDSASDYWTQFKQNWISHNKDTLDSEYQNWVQQHIEYNQKCVEADPALSTTYITDAAVFMGTYSAESFYESQYNEYMQQYQAQQPTEPAQEPAQDEQQQEIQVENQVVEETAKADEEVADNLDFDEME